MNNIFSSLSLTFWPKALLFVFVYVSSHFENKSNLTFIYSRLYNLKCFKHFSLFFLLYLSYRPKKMGLNLIILPLLTHFGGFTKPICHLQNSNFSFSKSLPIISDTLLSVWIFSTIKNYISIASQIYWYLTSMCFNRE
jgi:hypothetical protein